MKIASNITIVSISIWFILTILLIWSEIIDFVLYSKISITLFIIVISVVAIAIIKREYNSEEQMKKDKYLG
jgi:magnesium-transporting ATPase (P-type)